MNRRGFLATFAATAVLAVPGIARSRETRTLCFIPRADLPLPDPVANSAYIMRNYGLAMFDTLFGWDSSLAPQPQMVDGVTAGADGLLWRQTLRDGLRFHDGTPVLARNCVASIARWGKRDAFGRPLRAATDFTLSRSPTHPPTRSRHAH